MRRNPVALLFFLGFALLLAGCPATTIYDDGLWPLTVTVKSASGASLSWISCEAFTDGKSGAYTLENALPGEGIYSATQHPVTGAKLTVHVPTANTTRKSWLGETTRYFQFHKLVVAAGYDDGERKAVMIDIPDMRYMQKPRELSVEVP